MRNSFICEKVGECTYLNMQCLAMHSLKEKWKPEIYDTVSDVYEEIKKHCVMLILYALYCEFSEKKSIRQHLINLKTNFEDEELNYNEKCYVDRLDETYNEAVRIYQIYRKEKDALAKSFFADRSIKFEGLYKNLDKNEIGKFPPNFSGQELSLLNFLQDQFIGDYSIIRLLRTDKFFSIKNLPHYKFEDIYLPQIKDKNSGIYYDMQFSEIWRSAGMFLRTLNFFVLEANCCFERNYSIAKVLASTKMSKNDKEKEKSIFSQLSFFCDGEHKYQNYMVLGYDKILARYDYENVNASDIYNIVHLCNYVIQCVFHQIFDELEEEKINIKDLYEKELLTIDEFCEGFIGKGQHIIDKNIGGMNIGEINIKDFRDLYKN